MVPLPSVPVYSHLLSTTSLHLHLHLLHIRITKQPHDLWYTSRPCTYPHLCYTAITSRTTSTIFHVLSTVSCYNDVRWYETTLPFFTWREVWLFIVTFRIPNYHKLVLDMYYNLEQDTLLIDIAFTHTTITFISIGWNYYSSSQIKHLLITKQALCPK